MVATRHKIVSPESNDLVLQLRKRGVNQLSADDSSDQIPNHCVSTPRSSRISSGSGRARDDAHAT